MLHDVCDVHVLLTALLQHSIGCFLVLSSSVVILVRSSVLGLARLHAVLMRVAGLSSIVAVVLVTLCRVMVVICLLLVGLWTMLLGLVRVGRKLVHRPLCRNAYVRLSVNRRRLAVRRLWFRANA